MGGGGGKPGNIIWEIQFCGWNSVVFLWNKLVAKRLNKKFAQMFAINILICKIKFCKLKLYFCTFPIFHNILLLWYLNYSSCSSVKVNLAICETISVQCVNKLFTYIPWSGHCVYLLSHLILHGTIRKKWILQAEYCEMYVVFFFHII